MPAPAVFSKRCSPDELIAAVERAGWRIVTRRRDIAAEAGGRPPDPLSPAAKLARGWQRDAAEL